MNYKEREEPPAEIVQMELIPARLCAFTPEEKAEILQNLQQQLDRILKFRQSYCASGATTDGLPVLNYFAERLCIRPALKQVFTSRLEFVTISRSNFDFIEEYFSTQTNTAMKALIEEGIKSIVQHQINPRPPSLEIIENLCREILEKPGDVLARIKKMRSVDQKPSRFAFDEEFNLIKNVVLQILNKYATEGEQSIDQVEKILRSSNSTFREKLSTFLREETKILQWVVLSTFAMKVTELSRQPKSPFLPARTTTTKPGSGSQQPTRNIEKERTQKMQAEGRFTFDGRVGPQTPNRMIVVTTNPYRAGNPPDSLDIQVRNTRENAPVQRTQSNRNSRPATKVPDRTGNKRS